MKRLFQGVLIAFFLIVISSCNQHHSPTKGIQIAFLSDVHLSDIYGDFSDSDYQGVLNPGSGKFVIARTMQSQLLSTRIFNENYFAFLAALDDVAKRGIHYVVLPGDFSDDGQPYNIRGLKKILDSYSSAYGIQFFAINGNHDPAGPFTIDAGKKDFIGEGGTRQVIVSKEGFFPLNYSNENPEVVTRDICKLGYEEIVTTLCEVGFYPIKSYRYWETPFSTYRYEDYSYEKACAQSSLSQRSYLMDGSTTKLSDVSYLVEPVDGLWLLALDANVYLPVDADNGSFKMADLKNGGEYSNVIVYKKHLVKWVEKVVNESQKLNKTLIAFSHYPMVDFYEGAGDDMISLFGLENMQLHRIPDKSVAALFAKAGLKLHFAGHMHLNDTGIEKFADGSFLINVQVPSLVGYPAAYKILSIHSQSEMEIETIQLNSVPGFNDLFPLYEKEYAHLQCSRKMKIWNPQILGSGSYGEFVNWHLRELVRLRFLNNDWPDDFKDFLLRSNGKSLLKYAGVNESDTMENSDWSGFEMIVDFYRILNSDELAIADIGTERLNQYKVIINSELAKNQDRNTDTDSLQACFRRFMEIFNTLLQSDPSDHFKVDLKKGTLMNLESSIQ